MRCGRRLRPDARRASRRVAPTSSDARADSHRLDASFARGPMSTRERITIEDTVTTSRIPKRSSSRDLSSKIGLRFGFFTSYYPSVTPMSGSSLPMRPATARPAPAASREPATIARMAVLPPV